MSISFYDWCKQNNKILLEEWDSEKNKPLTPQTVKSKSGKKVSWKCSKGHEWDAVIASRTDGCGCPYCSNKRVLVGYNDFATTHPVMASQWHPTKNNDLKPTDVTYGFNKKKVHWICEHGHEWEATVASRVGYDLGCPFCSGRYVISGESDLATCYPEIAAEWDYEKNGDLRPEHVKPGTHQKVFWHCAKGHSYSATVHSRTNAKSGCPICSKEFSTSFPEKAIAFYLLKYGIDLEESYRNEWLGKRELDIYIPSLKLGIEYDGQAWHRSGRKDINKDLVCLQNGVNLIRVREPDCPKVIGIGPCYTLPDTKIESLNQAISFIFDYLQEEYGKCVPENFDVDVVRDQIQIYQLMDLRKKEKSVAAQYPNLCLEWNYERNGVITPEQVATGSRKQFWWICKSCGHEWMASAAHRTKGTGCPVCTGQVVKAGHNDLLTTHPKLAVEWNYEKNENLQPKDYRAGSHKIVWWKCSACDHEWKAEIKSRASGRGCPMCASDRRIVSKATPHDGKSLAERYPQFISEWHDSKNELTAFAVHPGSHKKIWWKCSNCGHEFERGIATHVRSGKCPICRNDVNKREKVR